MIRKNVSKGGFILFSLSLACVIIGIINGETAAVWEKAVRICLSCIGIG